MKSASIRRSLVEQIAVFLQALPQKQQGLPTQTKHRLVQLVGTAQDNN